jgi:cysteinyl-tRNA synthetase
MNESTLFQAHDDNNYRIEYGFHIAEITFDEDETSASSKNIIKLTEAIELYNVDTIRLLFLLNDFEKALNFNGQIMNNIMDFKKSIIDSLQHIQEHLISKNRFMKFDYTQKLNDIDLKLLEKFRFTKHHIFKFMCDCIKAKDVILYLFMSFFKFYVFVE